jgi:hypothetical protein
MGAEELCLVIYEYVWTKWWEGLLLEVVVYGTALVVSRIVSPTEDRADIT